AFGGYEAFSVTNGLAQLHRTLDLPGQTAQPHRAGQPTVDPEKGRPVEILLIGSDSRAKTAADGRSDTIMLLHLDADRKSAYLISFPRDMWVDIPGHGKNKINAAYAWGGTNLLASTINKLTGVTIDHAAVIDFAGFADLTDSVGGVTITNNFAFQSHHFDYPKGRITLSGEKALWFVRERHALPNGDFGRAANQRKVVKALAAKLASPQTLADPTKLSRVISNLAKYVTVDKSLTDQAILGLARSMKTAASSLVTLQAPVSGTAMIGGQSVDVVDTEQLHQLATALQTDTLAHYVALHKPDN
ncbi:MAG: LCP family protein, partial [Microlunatus sp.]|nr:LCP family protein [Microlunatus sp.]